MSAGKWTPGPWHVDDRTSNHVEGPDFRGICSTGGYHNNQVDPRDLADENDANARLIAAAPDLARALDAIIRISTNTKWDEQWILERIRETARAALALARGEGSHD